VSLTHAVRFRRAVASWEMARQEPDAGEPMDRVSAAMVILGGILLILAMAVLALERNGSPPGLDEGLGVRFQVALIVAAIALAATSFGFSRLVLRLQVHELPRVWQSIAVVVAGLFGLAFDGGVFDWPLLYLPTDPRAQPGNVLAAVLFFGFGAAVLVVLGAVFLFARMRARS
jgi:hypothetical protein